MLLIHESSLLFLCPALHALSRVACGGDGRPSPPHATNQGGERLTVAGTAKTSGMTPDASFGG